MADMKTYLTSVTITTDASGNGSKAARFNLTAGTYIAAMMIDPSTADVGLCSGATYYP